MSKLSMLIYWAIVAFIVGVFAASGSAQAVEVTVDLTALPSSKVGIAGSFVNEQRNRRQLSFLRSVAGIEGLANRISDIRLFDAERTSVSFKQLAPGEYLADRDFKHWSYTVDVSPDKNPNAAAHVSWSANGTGILMLMDLMPVGKLAQRSALIRFKTPISFDQYRLPIYPSEATRGEFFKIGDTDEAVFYVGGGWDNAYSLTDSFTAGEGILACCGWNFDPVDVSTNAKEIYNFYLKMFRTDSPGRPMIAVAKFPQKMEFGRWEAETRGSNVTIISSDMPFKQQSVQRLHEQLRHELFHLWIPNGVNLTGNYDWFYEGFALYQSLKMAVGMNRITFSDFLDTLSRAHTIDSARWQRTSLIDASKSRFAGSNTQVYARGMLVAFLTDLELLQRSKGDRTVEDLLRELYQKHRNPTAPTDGNAAVIELFKSNPGLDQIINRYVTGADKLDWTSQLAAAGIEDTDPGPLTTLKVNEKLNGRQKTLLDKLGYNNWRKLAPDSK